MRHDVLERFLVSAGLAVVTILAGCGNGDGSAKYPTSDSEVTSDSDETSASGATSDAAVHPFDLPKFQPVLSECRLQCPDTSPAIVTNGEFEGVTIPGRFYLVDGAIMVLSMDSKLGNRCELRHNDHWSVAGDVEKRLTANMRFTPLSANMDSVTIAQIHVNDFNGNKSGPLLMLSWRRQKDDQDDHLWANVRQDLLPDTKSNKNFDLGPRPKASFDLRISVLGSVIRIWIDGSLKLEHNVDYFDSITSCYFKTGVYLHGDGEQAIQYDELTITTTGSP